mmetsp:Transcript_48/g.162  ORF Transcript_48/g.162 Transcript_48/m.162 type:complete len:296 (+) Transcript_48:184-1071(+)
MTRPTQSRQHLGEDLGTRGVQCLESLAMRGEKLLRSVRGGLVLAELNQHKASPVDVDEAGKARLEHGEQSRGESVRIVKLCGGLVARLGCEQALDRAMRIVVLQEISGVRFALCENLAHERCGPSCANHLIDDVARAAVAAHRHHLPFAGLSRRIRHELGELRTTRFVVLLGGARRRGREQSVALQEVARRRRSKHAQKDCTGLAQPLLLVAQGGSHNLRENFAGCELADDVLAEQNSVINTSEDGNQDDIGVLVEHKVGNVAGEDANVLFAVLGACMRDAARYSGTAIESRHHG